MEKYSKDLMEAGMRMLKAAMSNPEAMTALSSMGGLGDNFNMSSGGTTTTTSGFGSGPVGGTGGKSGGKK
jgi:hypothetical protein